MASTMAMSPDQQQPHAAGAPAEGSSSPALRVHVRETTLVPPSSPSPPETSLPLTFFDVFWLNSPPVERLFLYHLAADADIAAIVSNLKNSLRQSLRAFYPLAGRLRLTPGGTSSSSDRYELHYRPGDAVTFTVADVHLDSDSLADDELELREVAKIAALVPPLPENGRAVFAVQATILLPPAARRRGLAIGVTVHHAACDGSASTHFLHTWAAACRGGGAAQDQPPPPPVIDRTLLADPTRLYDVFFKAAPAPATSSEDEQCEFVNTMSGDQLFATLTLSRDDLSLVKAAVAGEAARRGVAPPPRCSSLVAAFGLVWSCYQRAKEEGTGEEEEEGPSPTTMAHMVFAVDHRSRMRPAPLPEKYFGNCVGPAFAAAPKGELAAGGVGGIFSACAAVAAAIDEAVREVGTPAAVEKWVDRAMELLPLGMLSVAGSPRFRVYDLDFGFGRPAKVDVVSVARTGAVAVAESRRGDGGIELGISLQPAAMERFRRCFVDAVASLRHRT